MSCVAFGSAATSVCRARSRAPSTGPTSNTMRSTVWWLGLASSRRAQRSSTRRRRGLDQLSGLRCSSSSQPRRLALSTSLRLPTSAAGRATRKSPSGSAASSIPPAWCCSSATSGSSRATRTVTSGSCKRRPRRRSTRFASAAPSARPSPPSSIGTAIRPGPEDQGSFARHSRRHASRLTPRSCPAWSNCSSDMPWATSATGNSPGCRASPRARSARS